jgi:hypothetical protein
MSVRAPLLCSLAPVRKLTLRFRLPSFVAKCQIPICQAHRPDTRQRRCQINAYHAGIRRPLSTPLNPVVAMDRKPVMR